MRIGLVDVDAWSRGKTTFPNLGLMKLSAWYKSEGHQVEWLDPTARYDRVYLSKVFSDEYSRDYDLPINAAEVYRRGAGYAIRVHNDIEVYDKAIDQPLPYGIEHIYPDYSLYPQFSNTAYGFLTRGCPRDCQFCHVSEMQGRRSVRVADIKEFWRGQRDIVLLDANITGCPDCLSIFGDLARTGAYIEFNQGLDIRLLTSEKLEALKDIKYRRIHFAWDKPEEDLRPHFERLVTSGMKIDRRKITAYVLTNFGSTHDQDLERIMYLRSIGIQPYVMIYRKGTEPIETKRLARWCNSPFIFWSVPTFDEYRRTP